MKSKLALILIVIFSLLLGSCTTTVHTNKNGIPPGQAKKITGSQSAKEYAPGQQKK